MKIKITENQLQVVKENKNRELLRMTKSSQGCGAQRLVVFDFLDTLRESGCVNMATEARVFIINGPKWIKHYIGYKHDDPEKYKDVIEKSQQARDAVIQIAMHNYDKEEHLDEDDILSYVTHQMKIIAGDLLNMWKVAFHRRNSLKENELGHDVKDFTCNRCGHSWELDDADDKYVCHNCGKDNARD